MRSWNAGECCGYAAAHGIDDVSIAVAAIDALVAAVPGMGRWAPTPDGSDRTKPGMLAARAPEAIR